MKSILVFLFLVFSLMASAQNNICFQRSHAGFAEILVPVNQWHGSSVAVKMFDAGGNLAGGPITFNTTNLPKVTNASGVECYYIKATAGVATTDLVFEVSSPLDAAVSNLLPVVPQSQWNAVGTSDVCGVAKADVCFQRSHAGFAEILVPVNQWHGSSVAVKMLDAGGNLAGGPITFNTTNLPKVTNASGVECYYIKATAGVATTDLVFEVSSPLDAAVSNLLPVVPQSQWNAAGAANICDVAKADVCFNRLHGAFAEILVPVSQWHGNIATVRAYSVIGENAAGPVPFNTATLPRVTSAGGVEYYYIKTAASTPTIDLVFEVNSPLDAAVSNLLPVVPQSQWNDFPLQNTCISKAKGICINRNNAVYNLYLQKNQWMDTTARVKIYHANGTVVFNQLYSAMPVALYNGALCYAIAATYAPYANENVVIEVSSSKNAPVHMLLTPVQQLCYEAGPCTTPVTPAFTPITPVCKGSTFTLPLVSNEGVTGTWTPAFNNQATTTYTFMPDAGQCANSTTMTVSVKAGINWTSGDTSQILNAYTALSPVVYTLANGATGATAAGLPAGITATVNGSTVTISGMPTVMGVYPYTLHTTTTCGADSARGKITVNAMVADWKLAPNSYLFTGKDKNGNPTDGLYIPVKKAYAMWADNSNPELSLHAPIPPGSQASAYVYWEDVSGLIRSEASYKLELIGTGENARIKVLVDKAKGEGNAVISFHAGPNGNNTDPICWSWHIWVTDDVAVNGSTYRQGFETDKNRVPFSQVTNRDGSPYVFQWMNRNLGATNASFLGHDWNKSAGLMYQWGRKDPLPPLYYKDGTAYEINGAAGTFREKQFTQNSNLPFGWMMRPYNNPGSHAEVAQNIGYAIQHPLKAITFLSRYGHWFSDQAHKVKGDTYSTVNWDLWSDNRKGKWSKVSTSDTSVKADSRSYELKSPYDPCPCGWRIPSHYSSITGGWAPDNQQNLSSPWGRNLDFQNDDTTVRGTFNLNTANPVLGNVKVYPSLGYDFSSQSNRNIGLFPLTGAYVFMGPYEDPRFDYVRPEPALKYINWLSTTGVATATLSIYDSASARYLGFVSDYFKYPTQSKYRINVAQIAQSKGAGAVRCMSDPNEKHLGNFETEFIAAASSTDKTDQLDTLKRWTKDANSYIVMTNTDTEKRINLRKAYAMYKLYTSEQHQLPQGLPSVSVYWSTNSSLIQNVSLNGAAIGSSEMVVSLNQGQIGNAVVALHMGNSGTAADPVIWSWHIWAPETMPAALAPYKTEEPYQPSPSSGQIIHPTNNCLAPPLVTEFMDRNMGALVALPNSTAMDPATGKKAMGLHYQWGRKDPIPTFLDQQSIFRNGSAMNSSQYDANFTKLFSIYGAAAGSDKRYVKTGKILRYAIENPLTYLYNDDTTKDWISNEPGLEPGRWGHATAKSPYDPCPDGWRVPDVSFAFLNDIYNTEAMDGIKGTSPWYLGKIPDPRRTDGIMGIDQRWDGDNTVITSSAWQSYKGRLSTYTDGSGWAGYLFDDPIYSIGNYPVTGIRGETGVGMSSSSQRIGVWTAALGDHMRQNAIALMIRSNKMQTGIGAAPHQAMACRCAKINYDSNGDEIARYDPNAIPVPAGAGLRPANSFSPSDVNHMIQERKFLVFPNPVKDILRIDATDDKDYYYQVYNLAGQLVLQGKFVNKQTNVSSLAAGAYLIRINNAESVVKIVKQ